MPTDPKHPKRTRDLNQWAKRMKRAERRIDARHQVLSYRGLCGSCIERLCSIFQTASVRDLLNSLDAALNYLCVFFR
jgi:hypothetical protein